MALPQQAIEKLIQEPVATQGVYKELVLLATALFILMIVLYSGLRFGYKTYLEKSVAELDKNIATFGSSIPQADQDRTAQFYSALVNLRELLKTHTVATPAFTILERVANSNIYYTKMNLNTTTNELSLTGVARALSDAAAEAALLERQPEVDRVNLSNVGSQNGVWQFTLSVFLKPTLLHANGSGPLAPVTTQPSSTSSAVVPPPPFSSSSASSTSH